MTFQNLLDDIVGEIGPHLRSGEVASYVPELATLDPNQFGISVATRDGALYSAGDADTPFSIQSISKVFALALVLQAEGESIWRRVFREPSGNPYNSLVQLERENGIPRNPFINAGALVVTDLLVSASNANTHQVLRLLRTESDNASLRVDTEVALSEAAHSHRNRALAHFLASCGNLTNSVDTVLAAYITQCAIAASCNDLAAASLFLAAEGTSRGGAALLTPQQTKRVNAMMATCGTYDAAGEFAYRVGLPGKSGVGGGIIAVVPNKCTVCVWSPRLGASGNSVAGVAALDAFASRTGLSIF